MAAAVVRAGSTEQQPGVVRVAELDEAGCDAGGHAWTLRGCITQDEAQAEQARREQLSRDAAAARAQRKERTRLEDQGWSSFDEGIGAAGLFHRFLTTTQYESLDDPRCADHPCFGVLIRSDSATDCSRGLAVRIDVVSKGTVVDSAGARIARLPADSQARLVVPLSNRVVWGSRAEFTRVRCSSGS